MKTKKSISVGALVVFGALVLFVIFSDMAMSAEAISEKTTASSPANFVDTVYKTSIANYSLIYWAQVSF